VTDKIQVMLVEDHAGYREVITRALKRERNITLISQFGTAEIALRSLQDSETRNVPDLILLDLNLPGMSGLEALPLFLATLPNVKIMILTQSDNEADVMNAITLGASGYLLKSSTVSQIREGIQTITDGGAPIDPGVARFILNTLKTRSHRTPPEHILTEREMEILTLLAEGLVKKEIATQLGISSHTVITHVSHIYEKLHASNAPSAINKAYRLGIFPTRHAE
jgi:DNA-binding NarL/FixJ family response regulator